MMEDKHTRQSGNILPVLNFIFIVLLAFYVFSNQEDQAKHHNELVEIFTSKHTVDFSVSNIQRVDDVFMLANATQKEHLTGVMFTGRIINTQSVDRTNIKFKLIVGNNSKLFTINRISSGNSTGFNVYIPELAIQNARYALIVHESSQVIYFTK